MALSRMLLRRHSIRMYAAFSSVRHQSPPLLTAQLKDRLSHILQEYQGLQEKANAIGYGSCSSDHYHQLHQQISSLQPVVRLIQQLVVKEQEMKDLQEMLESSGDDEGLKSLAREEERSCYIEVERIQKSIILALVPCDAADQHSAILEVRAGVGGKEASLFTADIFQMYQKFCYYKQWKFEVLEASANETGGLKYASASLTGTSVFGTIKHESGVHRVQRVPLTEGAGRTHTSTMSVAILPQPSEIDMEVNPSDLRVETHRSSGPGGQSVNTTDSAVRLTHIPTGLVVKIQDDRSQHKNRSKALQILRARLYELNRHKAELAMRKDRKQQIGSGERHERIRTYQFLQDRVTDHRIGVSVHGVEKFMEGQEGLDGIVQQLQAKEEASAISKLLENHWS